MHDTTGRGKAVTWRGRALRALAVATALAVLPVAGVVGSPAQPAYAAEYPSWQDVQNAVANVNNAQALANQVQAQINALSAEVTRTQQVAQQAGEAYAKAQEEYDNQVVETQKLQGQADAAKAEADKAKGVADRLIAELAKPGGGNLTTNLIARPGKASDLLKKWGTMSKLTESSKSIFDRASQLQGTAQSLTDQANTAQKELDRRKVVAQDAFTAAQTAAAAAETALDAETEHKAQLEAQLVVLKERRAATQADYQKGLAAQWGAGAAGEVSPSGWARPAAGPITSSYGQRYHPIYHYWRLHTGTDIGAGCGAPIYATHGGTVTYSGWNGDLGNFIQIDHGDGTSSGYGHIVNGGLLVRIGQQVGPGQQIAKVGTTGGSTGCHLHFMIRINGNLTDPVPFMRTKGISLG
ncbi:M23 family metallopeptidase [Schumannella sp. 10F1B-5-1]|uniref:M23 family metallopeptidase n=1 Tax=Schumannella sp. 10F1B-5-1 TaxID=2590780 RepID=UPI0011316C54|nr:M23 family metallopeptidase [Schumannella sp. 10F1B-5-1]TPW71620.1 M23 family metallopeptidase [Schumannella sp. 10F1B-5-1]